MGRVHYSTITAEGEVSGKVSTLGISVSSIANMDRISGVQKRATEQLKRMKALKQFLEAAEKEATVELAADGFRNIRFRHVARLNEKTGAVSIETIVGTYDKGLFRTRPCAIAALSEEDRERLRNIVKKLNASIVQRAASLIAPVDIFGQD